LVLALTHPWTLKKATSPGETTGGEAEETPVIEPGPPETVTEPGVEERAPAEKQRNEPAPPFPLEAPQPGKVGIIVLDRQTGRPDSALSAAIRATLYSLDASLEPFVPTLDADEAGRLVQGDLSSLPGDGRTPWGAQYLLLASASRKALPQAAAHLESYALTLDARLITAADKSTTAWSNETHTGISVSADGALTQAAERCLRPITTKLTGGDTHATTD